jgi:hypothetical protein
MAAAPTAERRRARSGLILAALAALSACATATAPRPAAPQIEYYRPGEIVVPTAAAGTLTATDGCIRFVSPAGHSHAALFPPDTTYAPADRAILLPNGQRLPLGKPLKLVAEAWPNSVSSLPQCRGLRTLQVLHAK